MLAEPLPIVSLYLAWAAALIPLAAFGVIMVFLRRVPRAAAGVSVGSIAMSLACSVFLLARHWHMDGPLESTVAWMVSGDFEIPVGVLLDPLSLVMLATVAFIAFAVQLYSLGYMAGDPGYARYFGFMSLFAWAMISLVLAPNILQLFIFWELVGLSSYLLIGFWYEKFSASRAGKKAFVMTRAGDTLFFWGWLILLVWGGTLGILDLNNSAHDLSGEMTAASALLIFGGIIGKSAQFPLMTWLPDAMEGPTPVSALLHSATMVAAGVFLFGRLFPFFSQSDFVMTVCLAVGTISMLMSATMAMVSRDIKQVWAYSTISQLGFMIMALGAGGYAAGIFHLTTHAGFKALLFLCAGVLIHAYETNDMFRIGRAGGRTMKLAVLCMTAGALALSGIWPFSGFFSKEEIMGVLAAADNPLWLVCGLAGVFLTAYYSFRLIFAILLPGSITPGGSKDMHAGSYKDAVIYIVLVMLTALTLVLGFFAEGFLEAVGNFGAAPEGAHDFSWVHVVSPVLAVAGIITAWAEFGRKSSQKTGFAERISPVGRLFASRWYLDHLYAWIADRLLDRGIAEGCRKNENHVIEGILSMITGSVTGAGRVAAGWHRVMIQTKLIALFAVVFGLTVILLVV
ncbi:MAG: NADH-quinone oxidoreductase subunit L [Desulfobacterales bacterium]